MARHKQAPSALQFTKTGHGVLINFDLRNAHLPAEIEPDRPLGQPDD
jgi:hypothetical protein